MPVEAQACGTPVIAFGKGGALETVIPPHNSNHQPATGLFFNEQSPQSICDAVSRFETLLAENTFDSKLIAQHAQDFSIDSFKQKFQKEIDFALKQFA